MRLAIVFGIIVLLLGCLGSPQTGQLSEEEKAALDKAIQDEYKARATYKKVMEDFGPISPFQNILSAEEQHISALSGLYDKYGIEEPEDEWEGKVPGYQNVSEACQAGVKAEIENAALYDELMGSTDKQDILQVYQRLQKASRENHLPAFQRCS